MSPVTYRTAPLQGRRKPHIVHVERLKLYREREEDDEELAENSPFTEDNVTNNQTLQKCATNTLSEHERILPEDMFTEETKNVNTSDVVLSDNRPKRHAKKPDRLIDQYFTHCFVLAGAAMTSTSEEQLDYGVTNADEPTVELLAPLDDELNDDAVPEYLLPRVEQLGAPSHNYFRQCVCFNVLTRSKLKKEEVRQLPITDTQCGMMVQSGVVPPVRCKNQATYVLLGRVRR